MKDEKTVKKKQRKRNKDEERLKRKESRNEDEKVKKMTEREGI